MKVEMRYVKPLLLLVLMVAAGAAAAQESESNDDDSAAPAQQQEHASEEPRLQFDEESAANRLADTGVVDELYLERAEITGNQELPKLLYIVPWQKSGPGDLPGRPVNTLLNEVLAPLDREEFIRQVGYYHDLYGVAGKEE